MSHQHGSSLTKHPKQDFQVERIAFFSDAVFAIAITLLIIEFRPPHIGKDTTHEELWNELKELKYKFLALLLSFALIINYWVRHHTLFKHIHDYNKKIIMTNMLALLPVIFFPFTTSFLYENISSGNELVLVPYRLFFFNHVVAGLTMYYFYRTAMVRYKECSYPMTKEDAMQFQLRLLVMTFSFALVIAISYISFKYSALGVIPVAIATYYRKYYSKKKQPVKKHTNA